MIDSKLFGIPLVIFWLKTILPFKSVINKSLCEAPHWLQTSKGLSSAQTGELLSLIQLSRLER
jgi:hypothetical protein|tara:strand:+ start:72 stop:260 length:189 start_codon:yes stop_codon:yes gene_type:complete